jgi:membrane protease YdiL (CAAX protease family)
MRLRPPPPVIPATLEAVAVQRSDALSPEARNRLRWEVIIVIALFPGTAVITALTALAQSLSGSQLPSAPIFLIPSNEGLGLVLALLSVALHLAPVALVVHLLRRSSESLRTLGLDRSNLRRDLALGLGLLLLARWLAKVVIDALIQAHAPGLFGAPPTGYPHSFVVYDLARALSAGIVEEIIVLGYLTHRLRQLGWSTPALVAATVLLRASYHVEYGVGTLSVLAFGLMMTAVYLRTGRLLPVIVGHAAYDAVLTVGLF